MRAEVVVAIIGFLGTVITLIVGIYTSVKTYEQSELSKRIERSEHEALVYLKDQLAFYSSIHALLEANKQILNSSQGDENPSDLLLNALEHSNLGPEEQIIVDNIIIPNNERIVNKIIDYPHLIEGSTIPESYSQFLAHASVWKTFNEFHKQNRNFQFSPDTLRFPKVFAVEVEIEMRAIKQRYYDLIDEQKQRAGTRKGPNKA